MSEKELNGLSQKEVEENRREHGINVMTPPSGTPLWKRFIEKFNDPMIVILIVAGFLSSGISFYEWHWLGHGSDAFIEPVGIFIAILLASGLSFYFEQKADKEFDLLNKVNDDEPVQVIRDGNMTEIAKKDVVVGDIVILNQGNDIPADGVLIEAKSMNVDESTLTGEPMCAKTIDRSYFDAEATFPSNMESEQLE